MFEETISYLIEIPLGVVFFYFEIGKLVYQKRKFRFVDFGIGRK